MDWSLYCYTPYSIIQFFIKPDSLDLECRMLLEAPTWLPNVGVLEYFVLFALTCGLEAPFYMSIRSLNWSKRFRALIALNLATHPAVTFIWPHIMYGLDQNAGAYILAAETFAPVVEALLLIFVFKVGAPAAFLFAILANLVSWGFGLYLIV